MVNAREPSRISYLDQHPCTDMADGNLLVGDEVIESPAANGEHLCGLVSAGQEFLILRDRCAARTLAFGDVYFCHWYTSVGFLRYRVVRYPVKDVSRMGPPTSTVQYIYAMAKSESVLAFPMAAFQAGFDVAAPHCNGFSGTCAHN